jgi:hypothetical protein
MNIHVALHDPAPIPLGGWDGVSWVIGAFSTDEKAQAACEASAKEDAECDGGTYTPLIWKDFEARAPGGGKYVIVLVDLDVPLS